MNKKKPIYKPNFAPRLIKARNEMKEKGMSQREFAELIGISKSTIASYETGRTEPDLETLATIAVKTCHTIDYFLGLAEA